MSSRTRRTGAAVAALSACAAIGGWTAAPAGERPYSYLEGGPGTVLEDTVSVANTSAGPERFTLFGGDGHTSATGSFAVSDASDSTDSGTWIRFARTPVRIPARTRADIPFTVTVPGTALPGDHPAAIVVKDDAGTRATVRLNLRVTGPALPALGVEDVAVVRSGHGAEIRYTLVNRGNTAVAPSVAVRADGLLGAALRRPSRRLPSELPPGRRVSLADAWPHPPLLDRVRVRVTATAGEGTEASGTASYTAVPWSWALAAAPMAAGAAALRVRRRRRRRAVGGGQRGDGAGHLAGAAAT